MSNVAKSIHVKGSITGYLIYFSLTEENMYDYLLKSTTLDIFFSTVVVQARLDSVLMTFLLREVFNSFLTDFKQLDKYLLILQTYLLIVLISLRRLKH